MNVSLAEHREKEGMQTKIAMPPLFLYQAFKNNSFFPLGSGKIDFFQGFYGQFALWGASNLMKYDGHSKWPALSQTI